MKPADLIAAQQRQAIVDHFLSAAALSRETAVAFTPPTTLVGRRLFKRMAAFGAVRRTKGGAYWLDEKRLVDFRKESLARVLGIMALAGLAAAGAIALGG